MLCTKEVINYELPQNIWGNSLRLTHNKSSFIKNMEAYFLRTKKFQEGLVTKQKAGKKY